MNQLKQYCHLNQAIKFSIALNLQLETIGIHKNKKKL